MKDSLDAKTAESRLAFYCSPFAPALLVCIGACHSRSPAMEPIPQPPITKAEDDFHKLARCSAEELIQATKLPPHWAIEFLMTIEIRDKVIVAYKKILPYGTIAMPNTVQILYDKKTRTSRWGKSE